MKTKTKKQPPAPASVGRMMYRYDNGVFVKRPLYGPVKPTPVLVLDLSEPERLERLLLDELYRQEKAEDSGAEFGRIDIVRGMIRALKGETKK